MKTIVKWLNNSIVLSLLLVAGLITDLILIGRAFDLNKSDWATWVGAVGTVGALIGTIWIATSDRRARARAERDLAIVTLAAFTVRIGSVESALRLISQWMEHDIQRGIPTNYGKMVEVVKDANPWKPSELTALVCLERHIAARLALSSSAVETFIAVLTSAITTNAYKTPDGSTKMNRASLPLLKKNAHDLRQLYNDCMVIIHQSPFSAHMRSLDHTEQS